MIFLILTWFVCYYKGSFYDKNREPILYLVRCLCYKFLFNTNAETSATKLKPDSVVKVIVKALALDCCSNAIALCPHLLFKNVFTSAFASSSPLYIYDLLEYMGHSDDKMRTNTCLLIGQLIQTVLVESNGHYDTWLLDMIDKYQLTAAAPPATTTTSSRTDQATRCMQTLNLDVLVDSLVRLVRSDNPKVTNNICKRFAIVAFRSFLPTLMRSQHASYALEILLNLIHLKHSTYNLVKCELVDLLASLDFKHVVYAEQTMSSCKRYSSFLKL